MTGTGNAKHPSPPPPDFGRAWEIPGGLSENGVNASKSPPIEMHSPIRTIGGGTGGEGGSGYVATGSPGHPGAFRTRFRGIHQVAAPQVRYVAGAAPTNGAPPPVPPRLVATGVRGGVRTHDLAEIPARVTLAGTNGASTQFTASYRRTETHTERVNVGGRAVYMTPNDKISYDLMSHIYGRSTSRVA